MWWRRNSNTENLDDEFDDELDEDLEQWVEKLENQESDDQELAMAVQLRKLRLTTLHAPEDFRTALRANLLDQYVGDRQTAAPAGRSRVASLALGIGIALVIPLAALFLLFLYAWAPIPSWLNQWLSQVEPWTIPIVQTAGLLFGAIFLMGLIARIFFGIRSRANPGRISTAYGRSVSNRAMLMSASTAILLIVVTASLQVGRTNSTVGDLSLASSVGANLEMRNYAGPNMQRSASPLSRSLGLAAGGAMDVNNFRENIVNGYLPQPTDITYEGLFYDYYFDTGEPQPCDQLFCPTYAQARAHNPLTGEMEDFLSVGLTSGMAESDFQRKHLNLVVVIDISGSMDETFNRYYYDTRANGSANSASSPTGIEERSETKLQVAAEAVVAMLDHLTPEDRLGIVLFSDEATLAKSLSLVGESDMEAMVDHLEGLSTTGGTNMEAGYRLATDLLDEYVGADQDEYENRIMFLTDAQPNTGFTDRSGLAAMTAGNGERQLYTTFIGIGVDFNTDLTESISKVRGANYYSVHSPDEFVERLDEGFDYMVTPLVFDLQLKLDSPDVSIDAVYGSPEADAATGELMYVNTLFPSDSKDGEVKGGLVLLHLQRNSDAAERASEVTLTATYRDRSGQMFRNQETVALLSPETERDEADHYDHSGIRKGVLLARYAGLLKDWLGEADRGSTPERGSEGRLGEWEQQSSSLQVSPTYRSLFSGFAEHFAQEMDAIGDEALQQELDLLEKLSQEGASAESE